MGLLIAFLSKIKKYCLENFLNERNYISAHHCTVVKPSISLFIILHFLTDLEVNFFFRNSQNFIFKVFKLIDFFILFCV